RGRRSAAGDRPAELDRLEARVAPVHHEDVEALRHAALDVVGTRGEAAQELELLAGVRDGLDRGLPGLLVEDALAVRALGREDAPERPGARPQHADPGHGRDLAQVLEALAALDDHPGDQLALRAQRPQV